MSKNMRRMALKALGNQQEWIQADLFATRNNTMHPIYIDKDVAARLSRGMLCINGFGQTCWISGFRKLSLVSSLWNICRYFCRNPSTVSMWVLCWIANCNALNAIGGKIKLTEYCGQAPIVSLIFYLYAAIGSHIV